MSVPQHFSIVIVDIEDSGRLSIPEKLHVREYLYALLEQCREAGGIAEAEVTREDRGDGVYLLIDASISKRLIVEAYLGTLDAALAARAAGETRLRLRMILHQGEIARDCEGSAGPALDQAFAMVDSPQLKSALKADPAGRIGVVLAQDLYRSIICGHRDPDPTSFRMRRLATKYGSVPCWMTITGAREQPGATPDQDGEASAVAAAAGPSLTVGDQWNVGQLRNTGGVVGTINGAVSFGSDSGGR
jgi:hypothetical protein